MEDLEQQFNREDNLEEKYKKFEEGEKSFDELFGEIDPIRKKAVKENDTETLKKIHEIGDKMQKKEIERIEETEAT